MFKPQSIPDTRATRSTLRVRLLTAMPLAAMVCAAGCHKKMPRVFVPPPIQRPAPQALKLPADPDFPLNQAVELADLGLSLPDQQMPDIGAPPQPPPPPRVRPPIVTGPKPAPAPAAPEAPAPKIVQIFPAEQQRAYNRELDEILDRDQRTLEALARKNLAADQRDRMAQIRELLTQAKQAREQDLVTAVNLARRADTLAKDLLDRLP